MRLCAGRMADEQQPRRGQDAHHRTRSQRQLGAAAAGADLTHQATESFGASVRRGCIRRSGGYASIPRS
jgi:hypothetical protein